MNFLLKFIFFVINKSYNLLKNKNHPFIIRYQNDPNYLDWFRKVNEMKITDDKR